MRALDRSPTAMPACTTPMRLVVGLAALLGSTCARPGPAPSPPSHAPPPAPRDEVADLFALLDALGLPDTRGRPWVRVWTGGQTIPGDGPPVDHFFDGFLLAETDADFTVLHGLAPTTWPRRRPNGAELRLERQDLAAALRDWLAGYPAMRDGWTRVELARSYQLTPGLYALVLARAACREDLPDLCAGLLAAARQADERSDPGLWAPRLRGDLAEATMWQAKLAAGGTEIARPALRDRFRRVVTHFPGSAHAVEAADLVAVLDATGRVEECKSLLSLGELAARMLAAHLGVELACTWPPHRRARAVAEIHNAIRARRGQAPLALPAPPAPPVPAALTDARAALTATRSPAEATAALRPFAAAGLAGLRPLQDALAALPAAHVARAPGAATATKLASIVRAVDLDDVAATTAERAAILALAGKPLTADAVLALAGRIVLRAPKGHLTIAVHRDGAGLGTTLRIRSVTANTDASDQPVVACVARVDAAYIHAEHAVFADRIGFHGREVPLTAVLASPADRDAELFLDAVWVP